MKKWTFLTALFLGAAVLSLTGCDKDDDDDDITPDPVVVDPVVYEADVTVSVPPADQYVIGEEVPFSITFSNDTKIEQVFVQVSVSGDGFSNVLLEFEELVDSEDDFVFIDTVTIPGIEQDGVFTIVGLTQSAEDASALVSETFTAPAKTFDTDVTFFSPTNGGQVNSAGSLQVQATLEGVVPVSKIQVELRDFADGNLLYTNTVDALAGNDGSNVPFATTIPQQDLGDPKKKILYIRAWNDLVTSKVAERFIEFDLL